MVHTIYNIEKYARVEYMPVVKYIQMTDSKHISKWIKKRCKLLRVCVYVWYMSVCVHLKVQGCYRHCSIAWKLLIRVFLLHIYLLLVFVVIVVFCRDLLIAIYLRRRENQFRYILRCIGIGLLYFVYFAGFFFLRFGFWFVF